MLETSGERASYRVREGVEQVLREEPTETTKGELAKETLTAKGKYRKFVNLLRLLKSLLPKGLKVSESTLKRFFYDSEHLPFDPQQFEFHENNLGNGGQVRVYLLASKTTEPSMAIKVFRPENESSDPITLATRLKHERNEIEDLYSSIPDLVPKEHYIVMEDPFEKGRSAATIIEEFIGGELFDIFSFSPEDLSILATDNPILKDQLVKFIQTTIQNEISTGEVVDVIGPKNIVFVKTTDNSYQLILIDPHGYIKTRGNADKQRQDEAREKIEFLKQVLTLTEKHQASASSASVA